MRFYAAFIVLFLQITNVYANDPNTVCGSSINPQQNNVSCICAGDAPGQTFTCDQGGVEVSVYECGGSSEWTEICCSSCEDSSTDDFDYIEVLRAGGIEISNSAASSSKAKPVKSIPQNSNLGSKNSISKSFVYKRDLFSVAETDPLQLLKYYDIESLTDPKGNVLTGEAATKYLEENFQQGASTNMPVEK